jgi:AAA domain/Bifunctional DNA primase/polymerase, N-terminal
MAEINLPLPRTRQFERPTPAAKRASEPRPWTEEGKALKAAKDAAKTTNGSAAAENAPPTPFDAAAERTALLYAGYVPTPCVGKEPILKEWTERTIVTDEIIEQWREQHPDVTNTGVLTFKNPVVDIDIWDGAVVAEIERVVRELAGNSGVLLTRTGRAPKMAIPFRLDGSPFKKKSTPVFLDAEGRSNKLEILAEGQQFIVSGIHPDTKAPYIWNKELRLVAYNELPPISEADADKLKERVTEILRATGWQQKSADKPKISERAAVTAPRAPSSRREQAYGQAALRNAAAELAAAAPTTRNDTLNAKAFTLARQAAAGRVDLGEAEKKLLDAAHANGMIKDDGLRAAKATIKSGFEDGLQQPAPALLERPAETPATQQAPPQAPLLKSSAEFIAAFVPPDYVVVGVLQRRFLYALTGMTGAGKTSIGLLLAACAALGLKFAGCITKKIRVLYAAAENPDDVRMRWIALAGHMGFDPTTIEVYFTDRRFKISEMEQVIAAEAQARGGNFGLVIVDTSPAFYEGDDESSRTQMGAHALLLRGLINTVPGGPCVLALCHPVKNPDLNNLLPAGGGNFLNEVDGNLTAIKSSDITTSLHWAGKFRGPEFAPLHFILKTVTHPDIKDSDDRKLPQVVCEALSEDETEEIVDRKRADENDVLAMIADDPAISYRDIAVKMGWKLYNGEPYQSKASRTVQALLTAKLIKTTRSGRHVVTDAGQKAIDEIDLERPKIELGILSKNYGHD